MAENKNKHILCYMLLGQESYSSLALCFWLSVSDKATVKMLVRMVTIWSSGYGWEKQSCMKSFWPLLSYVKNRSWSWSASLPRYKGLTQLVTSLPLYVGISFLVGHSMRSLLFLLKAYASCGIWPTPQLCFSSSGKGQGSSTVVQS